MSEKAKVDKPSQARINRYGFLALWAGAQALGWLGFVLLMESDILPPIIMNNNWVFGLLLGLCVGIPTALLQKLALYLGFGRLFKGWTRVNILGWLAGGLFIGAILETGLDNASNGLIQILALMMLPALAQAWIFRRYFERTWLWLLATGVASTVFVTVINQWGDEVLVIFPAFGTFALVTGLTLVWLFGMQASEGKQKIDKAADFGRLEDGREERDEQDAILSVRDGVKSAESD